MPKLKPAEIERIAELHKEIQFYGTPENGYADSGFWKFLRYVKTKDPHDQDEPVKLLMADGPAYMVVMFLYMLACQVMALPKSRQMRVSWGTTAFSVWHTMTAPYRETLYQTKKETDAFAMVSEGAKNPAAGRMDFIIQHLPDWLADPNIASGRGNQVGRLTFSPRPTDEPSGVRVPWYGGSINAIPQGGDQVRQYTPSLFISDESAFQDEFEAAMVALKPAVTGGGKSISVSSVESGSAFNRMVLESEDGRDPINEIHPTVQRGLEMFGMKWPKGLRSWKTPSGVWCLEVHYTADPAKDPERDGAQWVKDAVKGYVGGFDSPGWQTEMEINYNAGAGAPVFNFFINRSHPIFTKRVSVDEVINTHRIYGGFDYGSDDPAALEIVSFDKFARPHWVWELYEPCLDVRDYAEKAMRCPYWEHIEYIMCDPSITARTQHTAHDKRSINEVLAEHGLNFRPGRRGVDVPQALRLLTDYWSEPDTNPQAWITDECPNMQRELIDLRWDRHLSEAVASRKNNPGKIRQKNNHAFDASCYLLDTRPRRLVAPVTRPAGTTFNDLLDMADKKARLEKTRRGRRQLLQGAWR